MTPTAHRNSTFAKVTFHTFEHGIVAGYAEPGTSYGGRQRTLNTRSASLVGDVVNFSTTKQLEGEGSWSLTVKGAVYGDTAKGGQPWPDVLRDGDWVTINVVKNGVETHVMLGRLDSVNVSIGADGGGAATATVSLAGRDVTAAAVDTPLHWNPYDPLHNNAAGIDMVKLFGSVFAGRPNEAVPHILTAALGDNGANFGHPPLVPPGVFGAGEVRWSDGLDITARVAECRGFIFAPSLINMGEVQSIWGLANQHANPAFNELWLDTDPDPGDVAKGRKAYLNFRERPFVNVADGAGSPWFKLAEHVVPLSTVTSLGLGRGKNRVNYLQFIGAFAGIFQGDTMALAPPAYSEESIKRWGLRKMEMSSSYLSAESGGGADNWGVENQKGRNILVSWNLLNPSYWEGTIALAEMRPEIRVGTKLVLTGGPPAGYPAFPSDQGDKNRAMTFYISAIRHDWAAGTAPNATTQMLITHGYVEGDRVAHAQAEWAKWRDVGPSLSPEPATDASTLGDYPEPVDDGTRLA